MKHGIFDKAFEEIDLSQKQVQNRKELTHFSFNQNPMQELNIRLD